MPKLSRPRRGSLQFYPRKRAKKILPSVNWKHVNGEGILGFISYKVGMATAIVKDNTEKSLTVKKNIAIPVTILETPNIKVFALRFYKNNAVLKDIVVSVDKELKRKVRLPKSAKKLDENVPPEYDDIRLIVYSLAKQTGVKKTPDLIEVALKGDNKLELAKELIGKEITLNDFLKYQLLDIHGITKGKGTQGPVKRFGIKLKFHKSEKGRRRPGSLAPWHPARVTFHAPMAGQLGLFSRLTLNSLVISYGSISDRDINPGHGFSHYGKIKSSYLILKGSIQGSTKRQLILTPSFRPSKKQSKKKYELIEVITK